MSNQRKVGAKRWGRIALVPMALALLGTVGYWLIYPTDTNAFGSYLPNIPNSNVNSCNTCHGNMGPGSATSNNAFKNGFASNNHAWSAAFAAMDSDGDGFTNGEELQDPSGAFMSGGANPGNSALVSNPSDAASLPPAPTMTALMGLMANSTISGTASASVSLSTTANGSPVGITRVDYIFKTAGTQTVVKTISSTTAAAYTANIDTTQIANGAYDVTATCFDKRSAGSGGPRTASLTVSNVTVANKPKITTQPSDAAIMPGSTAMFSIVATGATSFQWRKNGSPLSNGGHVSNATTATLTISTADINDAGLYDCVATNTAGSTTSTTASLVVGSQASNSYVKLASIATGGSTAKTGSVPPTINGVNSFNATNRCVSTDGRIIVFRSNSDTLVPNKTTNTNSDVFFRDNKMGKTTLISTDTTGTTSGDKASDTIIVSADGRYAAFNSASTNLFSPGPSVANTTHVYRRDLQLGVTIPAGIRDGAITSSADYGTLNTNVTGISNDGRYVLFFYDGATQYDPNKSIAGRIGPNYYLRDCTNNTTTLVTVNSGGTGVLTTGSSPGGCVMTPDGRYVVFVSDATDVGPAGGTGVSQVYLWDRTNPNVTLLVSSTDGTATTRATSAAAAPSISSDGRYVAFQSAATNLNANGTGANAKIFRRDMQTNATKVVSEAFSSSASATGNSSNPQISSDGRYVVFESLDGNLVASDGNGFSDIFRRDMNDSSAAKNAIVSSKNGTGTVSTSNGSINPRISDDGQFVVFESNATDLVGAVDPNGKTDVFRRDCANSSTILLSIKYDLTTSSSGASQNPFVSGNGLTAMFNGNGGDLVPPGVKTDIINLDVFSATFNQPPTIALPSTGSVTVGSAFAQAGSFTDPNGPDTFTGTVDYDDGNGPQTLTLSGTNTFNLNNTYMTTGVKNVKVTIIDSANGNTTATLALTVNPLPPVVAIGASANPAGFQQAITFTATIASNPPPSPTGVVTFNDGNFALGSSAVSTTGSVTTALFTISTLSAGSHSITAVYSGDANFGASTSVVLTEVINPSLPVITSAATATATVGQSFSYQITANGSQPITYTIGALPAGLTFDTDTISGTPTSGGITSFRVTATNSAGTTTKNIVLTINRTGSTANNNAPVIASPPVASPNPGSTGSPVTLVATATDADNDAILYTWDFGDGTTDFGTPITHMYTAAGVYSVTLTVTDGIASVSSTVMVAINDSGPGGPANTVLTVTKGTLKFNFKTTNSDGLTLAGTIPIGAGFNPNSKAVTVIVGSYAKQFSFDPKGKSALKLTGKKNKDGSFKDATLKFTLSLNKTSIFAGVASLGFTNADIKTPATISGVPVILNVGGSAFLATLKATYKASKGKSGSAALKP